MNTSTRHASARWAAALGAAALGAGLLARLRGDAVLQYHHEIVWLLRRGDDLSLNERDDLWPARRLTLMFHPYRRATHTFSED